MFGLLVSGLAKTILVQPCSLHGVVDEHRREEIQHAENSEDGEKGVKK